MEPLHASYNRNYFKVLVPGREELRVTSITSTREGLLVSRYHTVDEPSLQDYLGSSSNLEVQIGMNSWLYRKFQISYMKLEWLPLDLNVNETFGFAEERVLLSGIRYGGFEDVKLPGAPKTNSD